MRFKEGSAELEWADKSALSRSIFPIPTNISQYVGLGYCSSSGGNKDSQATHSRAQSEETPWQTTQDSRDDNSWWARWRPEQRWLCPCISIPGGHSRSTRASGLKKFIQPLRGVGPGGIPVAAPDAFSAPVTGVTHYSLTIAQFTDQLHPYLGPTKLWGYNPVVPLGDGAQHQRHLGGIIVAQRGTPIQITFTNKLPPKHILPVDTSANFPDAQKRQNATTTHLHGGFTPWISDGGPFTWFTPDGDYGPSVIDKAGNNLYKLLNPRLKRGQAEYYYPNNQSARLGWYHDHAHDLTRLNAYAGIASAYIIRDSFEANLRNLGLPNFVENGGREIPIVIQDKIFVGPDILTKDPTWPGPTGVGSLWYPHIYETDRWELGPSKLKLPDPSVIPEMFGDTMLANGTVYPEATVEARRYRLRVLNACQARFLNLQLYVDDGSPDGITLNRTR